MRNLRERLQSGGYSSHEPIEVHVQQKGLPFLNFEVSQIGTTLLLAPSKTNLSDEQQSTSDLYLSTVSVRDFCLMNQEKVSQPQILLRSSNYGAQTGF